MTKFGVSKEKLLKLQQWMEELEIYEEDIVENFIRGSGSGGQKINKSSTCVQLIHKPSGIEIKCQKERSQSLNRFFARRELCEKIATKIKGIQTAKKQKVEKIKRQKRRRSKKAKEKVLKAKKQQGEKKQGRKKVELD